jgi:hypothetical protein
VGHQIEGGQFSPGDSQQAIFHALAIETGAAGQSLNLWVRPGGRRDNRRIVVHDRRPDQLSQAGQEEADEQGDAGQDC